MKRTIVIELDTDNDALVEKAENRVSDALKYLGVDYQVRTAAVGQDWWHYPATTIANNTFTNNTGAPLAITARRPLVDHGEQ